MTSIIYIPGSVGLVSDMPRAGLMSSETNVCKRLCVAVRESLWQTTADLQGVDARP